MKHKKFLMQCGLLLLFFGLVGCASIEEAKQSMEKQKKLTNALVAAKEKARSKSESDILNCQILCTLREDEERNHCRIKYSSLLSLAMQVAAKVSMAGEKEKCINAADQKGNRCDKWCAGN
jgi:hypothetical protein